MVMVHKTYKNHTNGHQYGTRYYEFSDDDGGEWGGGLRKENTFNFAIPKPKENRTLSFLKHILNSLDPQGRTLVALHGHKASPML
jgi:type I restriction-modification system DNA methylase subunit